MSRVMSGLVAMMLWSSYAGAQAPQPPPGLPFPQAPPRDTSKTGTAVRHEILDGQRSHQQTGTAMSVSGLQWGATPSTYELLSGGGTARINDDATSEMRVLPGNYLIRMTPQGIFANVRIKPCG